MRRLIIRPGAIGDFIVSLPALEALRTDYLEVWTHRRTVPLVRFADRVRAIDATGLELTGITQGPPPELAGFDEIVSWYGANRLEFREAVHGLPFRFFAALPREGVGVHATDFYLHQVGASPGAIPRLVCDQPRENFAVIQPFSGSPRKNWALAKFRALAAHLQHTMSVHWCAGPEDPPLPGAVRMDDLWDLACWIARARVYIGNDSGITHLAAAVGSPVLAIFGPTDPRAWAPRGEYVRVVTVKMET
jgi:ADP-heptose:LPS heptosyltransferase